MIALLVVLVIVGWLLVKRPLREHNTAAPAMDLYTMSGGATGTPGPTGTTESGPTGTTETGPTGTSEATGGTGTTTVPDIAVPRPFNTLSKYESPYTESETARIVNLSPDAKAIVTEGYSGLVPPDGVTKDQIIARFLTTIVAYFYTYVYQSLTTPVSFDIIANHVDSAYASSSRANRAAYKDLLRRYYVPSSSVERTEQTFRALDTNEDEALSLGEFGQVTPAQVVGLQESTTSGTGGTTPELTEFERSLQAYAAAAARYRLTGSTSFLSQANAWKTWIDRQINDAKTAVTDNAAYIGDFLDKYESSDTDLANLQSDLRMIRQKGPEIQAQYETEHEAQKQEPLDFSSFYPKFRILGLLILGAIGVSFFA